MICPKCGSEFVEGIDTCPSCDTQLVETPSGAAHEQPAPELVVVLAAGDANTVAIAKSLLLDAGIEFAVSGEEVQDLFGYGRFPAGYNVAMGPVRLCVRPEDALEAREVLARLSSDTSTPADDIDDGGDAGAATRTRETWARRAARIVIVAVLVIFALEILAALGTTVIGSLAHG